LPLLTIEPKRAVLARFGVSIVHLQEVVANALGGEVAGRLYEGDRRSDIVVRLPEKLRADPDALERLPISLPEGGYVPLREVAELNLGTGYNQILRENGKRRVVVTSNVSTKYATPSRATSRYRPATGSNTAERSSSSNRQRVVC
jgi:heavy metal efflux system protein